MISKIYYQFWHCLFKNTLEKCNFCPIEIERIEQNGTFNLFETSVNGNVTFAYSMTFHCTSV